MVAAEPGQHDLVIGEPGELVEVLLRRQRSSVLGEELHEDVAEDGLVVGERAVEVEHDGAHGSHGLPSISDSQTIRIRSPRKTSCERSTGRPRRGVRGALDEHHRRAGLDAERLGLVGTGERRLEPLEGAHGNLVVAAADQLVERAVERLVEQAGKRVGGVRAALERDGRAVREAHALDREHARPEQRLVGLGVALACAQHPRAGGDAEAAELVGEGGGAGELEPRVGDERAAVAALAPAQAPSLLERSERLAQRHAADAEPLGELSLGGQAVARRERAPVERALERSLDLRVRRAAARLDGGETQWHYGLDFSAWT